MANGILFSFPIPLIAIILNASRIFSSSKTIAAFFSFSPHFSLDFIIFHLVQWKLLFSTGGKKKVMEVYKWGKKNEPSNCRNFPFEKVNFFSTWWGWNKPFHVLKHKAKLISLHCTDRLAVSDTFFICFVKPTNVNHLIITLNHFFS